MGALEGPPISMGPTGPFREKTVILQRRVCTQVHVHPKNTAAATAAAAAAAKQQLLLHHA